MALNLSVPSAQLDLSPRITVIGVGGAGGNAVNNMIRSKLEGVEFVIANTDAQAMSQSLTERRIQLGVGVTQGLGAGSKPDVGRMAAEEALAEVGDALAGSHMVFIAAGMGGGTGTGAAPVIARAAREHGILTVGVVTKPFNFEGQHRMRLAEAGIIELQQHVDTLIIIPNQNLFRIANERTTFADAFKMADDVLYSGVRGVTDLMIMPGLINLDFADIRSVMGEMGKAMMGTGEAEGENRALDAAQKAISNPLLDDVSMKGARGVLINVTGGPDMTLFEVDEAANRIRDEVDPEANIIFGSTFDESMTGRMRVSVVATGIDAGRNREDKPTVIDISRGRAAAAARNAGLSGSARAEAPAPVVASTAVAAVAAPEPAVEAAPAAPAVARQTETAFIPPKPVEPVREPAVRADAPLPVNAIKAADLANAGARSETAPAPKRRGISFIQHMTGIGLKRQAAPPAASTPAAPTPTTKVEPRLAAPAPRTATAGQIAAPAPAPVPQAAQPRLGGLEPPAASTASQQDDLLDIPAFLRRQAN
jgi:cell division protein FtsZ